MSDPAAAITSALDRHRESVAAARETAIALAVEREQKANGTAGADGIAPTPAVSPAIDAKGNE